MQSDELAHCIRAWRDRLDPADAGLPAGPRRRAPGLRREGLSDLAGLSVDYLSRLEQGRASNPSPQVLAALARALRLSEEERRHLYLVAMNDLGTALVGDMTTYVGRDRNLAWRQFNADHSRFRSEPAQTAKREAELVADLHAAATAYPEDERLAGLIAEEVLGGVSG